MIITTVSGPAGSGKTHLLSIAAAALSATIHTAPLLTPHGIDMIMRSAARSFAQHYVFFDEATPEFRVNLETKYSELQVRVVLIGEFL